MQTELQKYAILLVSFSWIFIWILQMKLAIKGAFQKIKLSESIQSFSEQIVGNKSVLEDLAQFNIMKIKFYFGLLIVMISLKSVSIELE